VFLFQNLTLVAMTFVIFWVTFFPLISEALTGTKVSVGPPAYRPFIVPLALILVLLSGVGPLIAWRRVTSANLKRSFAFPVATGLAALVALLLAGGIARRPLALIMFALGAFVVVAVAQELWRGTTARRAMTGDRAPVALAGLVRRNRRRYGGYIVHAGLAVLLVGVAASSSFQHSHDVLLLPGQKVGVDGYTITYVKPTAAATPEKIALGAVLDVSKRGRHVTTLTTWRGFYPAQDPTLGILGRR
jgi:cytochrome c-type biogenesis protein CcmF